ncbi:MAG TPA: histidine kinase dimerization/phosphoacceptor domain -containing protein [Phenylobacterium sp.]|nr:histidine kinase dimerization/phosphoacceptor domain -containing protein [Phenylobacterium sp.]
MGRYATALLLVLAGFVARLALEPVFGATHTYTVFYPVVIVAAYFLGARPAILAAALSITVAYWCFDRPTLAWKADFATLAPLSFFAFTSAVSIYFITGMARAMRDLGAAQRRAEDLAESHAELFRNLNERVTNHLQLVAALLQLQARDERDKTVGRALSEASARTLLISRAHRNLGGEVDKTLDFDTFARQLLDATLAARGSSSVQVHVEPQGARLQLDEATSVAIVMLECIHARLQVDGPAVLRIGLRRGDREAKLTISEAGNASATPPETDLRLYLIEAMVEQQGGRFSSKANGDEAVSELVFPVAKALEGAAADTHERRRMLH